MPLFSIFTNNLLPILLLSGAGFLLGRFLAVDARPLGRVIFYILSPLLIFNLLTQTQLSFDKIGLMAGFAASVMVLSAGLAYLAARILRLERGALTAVVLTSFFLNAGNLGLPLVSFAFGQQALAYASIYYATTAVLIYTVGVVIASLGQLRLKQALLGLFKVPAVYAVLLALVVVRTGWQLPLPLERAVTLAAGGAVPAMLVLLGLELQRAEWSRNLRAMSTSVTIRLLIGPLLGLGLSALFGLPADARQAGITQSGMPSAVLTTILASEYKVEPSLVTAIVFTSTLLSPLTLTPLLYFLGS